MMLSMLLFFSFSNTSFTNKIDEKEYIEIIKEMQEKGELKKDIQIDKILSKIYEYIDNGGTKKETRKQKQILIGKMFPNFVEPYSKSDVENGETVRMLESYDKKQWDKKEYQNVINKLQFLNKDDRYKSEFEELNKLLKVDQGVIDEIKTTLEVSRIISLYKKSENKNEYIAKSISLKPKERAEILDIILEIYQKTNKNEKSILKEYFENSVNGVMGDKYGEKYIEDMMEKFDELDSKKYFK